jgi:hypothetical protein
MGRRGSDQKGAQMPTFGRGFSIENGDIGGVELIPTGNLEI